VPYVMPAFVNTKANVAHDSSFTIARKRSRLRRMNGRIVSPCFMYRRISAAITSISSAEGMRFLGIVELAFSQLESSGQVTSSSFIDVNIDANIEAFIDANIDANVDSYG